MLDLLEEIKGMIERHCGDQKVVAKEAVREVLNLGRLQAMEEEAGKVGVNMPTELLTLAQRQPAPLAYQPPAPALAGVKTPALMTGVKTPQAPVLRVVSNPEGPKLWNEFKKQYIDQHRGEKEFNEVVKNAAEAYKKYKSNKGLPQGRAATRRLPKRPIGESVAELQSELRRINAQRAELSAKVMNIQQAAAGNANAQKLIERLTPYLQPSAEVQQVQNALNGLAGVELTPAMSRKLGKSLNAASMKMKKEAERVNAAIRTLNMPMETLGRASLPTSEALEAAQGGVAYAPSAKNFFKSKPAAPPLGGVKTPSAPSAPATLAAKNFFATKAKKATRRVKLGEEGETPKQVRTFNKALPSQAVGLATPRLPTPPVASRLPTPPASAAASAAASSAAASEESPFGSPAEEEEYGLDVFGQVGESPLEPVSAAAPPAASPNRSLRQLMEESRRASPLAEQGGVKTPLAEQGGVKTPSAQALQYVNSSNEGEDLRHVQINGKNYMMMTDEEQGPEKALFIYNANANGKVAGWHGYYNTRTGQVRQTNAPM